MLTQKRREIAHSHVGVGMRQVRPVALTEALAGFASAMWGPYSALGPRSSTDGRA